LETKKIFHEKFDSRKMRVQLCNLSAAEYNGAWGMLVPCDTPRRLGVRLDSGKCLSVPLNAISRSKDHAQCVICLEPMDFTNVQTLGCGHKMHWWCIKEWRCTAQQDVEASGARCPTCRSYIGLSHTSILNHNGMEIIVMALGYIYQAVYRIQQLPEPSEMDEFGAVWFLAMKYQEKYAQTIYDNVQEAVDAYKKRECLQTYTDLHGTLTRVLTLHCSFATDFNADTYAQAIRMWLKSMGFE
jgi:hypothetical protein